MKRILATLVTALVLTVALCATASASDFDSVAQELSTIGMFRGTGSGFELDRAPTRGEAAIMLVRLYGAEEQAKADYDAGKLTHPFTDVGPIASPSVAWLYQNGITNGTTATTFGSSGKCNVKMYTTFLLRALGYQDPADFTYDTSLTFAAQKGFYSDMMFSGDFLRDDLAALTYQALAADMKNGSGCLLENLVSTGAVSKTAAAPILEKINAYRTLSKISNTAENTAMDMNLKGTMKITVAAGGETMTIPTEISGRIQAIADAKDPAKTQLSAVVDTKAEGVENSAVSMWMKDGWMYMSLTAEGETSQIKYPVDDVLDLSELGIVDLSSTMDVSGLAMIDSIATAKSGSDTVYTVTIGKGLGGMMDSLGDLVNQDDAAMDLDIGSIKVTYTVDKANNLKACSMRFSASAVLAPGTTDEMKMAYDYDISMQINATGSAVKITWPDFSKFVEVDPNAQAA